jgi:endogenous inhibitor of DNA gyrase (YacG/DUF329 family)
MTAAEIDEGAVDRLLTVLGEHGRIERDLARKAIIAALPAPASGGAVQPCDVCGKPVEVHAVSPSQCFCSAECANADPAPASGAAEMRERAAREAETSKGYPTDVSERIRALPVTEPGSNP